MKNRTEMAVMILQSLLVQNDLNLSEGEQHVHDERAFNALADRAVGYADAVLRRLGEPIENGVSVSWRPPRENLDSLGVSGRATAPLGRQGILNLHDLSQHTMDDIAAIRGVSEESVNRMSELLTEHGLSWKTPEDGEGDHAASENPTDSPIKPMDSGKIPEFLRKQSDRKPPETDLEDVL